MQAYIYTYSRAYQVVYINISLLTVAIYATIEGTASTGSLIIHANFAVGNILDNAVNRTVKVGFLDI